MAYKQGQPFNDNMSASLVLCWKESRYLRDMVKSSGAHSTDMQSPENIDDLYAKCKPYADRWVPKADELWTASNSCAEGRVGAESNRVLPDIHRRFGRPYLLTVIRSAAASAIPMNVVNKVTW